MLPFGNKTCQSCTALESIRAQWPYDASVGKGGRARTRTDAKEAPPAELSSHPCYSPLFLGHRSCENTCLAKGGKYVNPVSWVVTRKCAKRTFLILRERLKLNYCKFRNATIGEIGEWVLARGVHGHLMPLVFANLIVVARVQNHRGCASLTKNAGTFPAKAIFLKMPAWSS